MIQVPQAGITISGPKSEVGEQSAAVPFARRAVGPRAGGSVCRPRALAASSTHVGSARERAPCHYVTRGWRRHQALAAPISVPTHPQAGVTR